MLLNLRLSCRYLAEGAWKSENILDRRKISGRAIHFCSFQVLSDSNNFIYMYLSRLRKGNTGLIS